MLTQIDARRRRSLKSRVANLERYLSVLSRIAAHSTARRDYVLTITGVRSRAALENRVAVIGQLPLELMYLTLRLQGIGADQPCVVHCKLED